MHGNMNVKFKSVNEMLLIYCPILTEPEKISVAEICANIYYVRKIWRCGNHILSEGWVQQSPEWEGNRSSSGEEIPQILWKPKADFQVRNSPPSILSLFKPHEFIPRPPI